MPDLSRQRRGYARCHVPQGYLARLRWWWWLRRHQPPPSLVDGRDYTGWTVTLLQQVEHAMLPPVGTAGVITRCERSGAERLHHIEFPDAGEVLTGLPSRLFELAPPPSRG